MKFLIACSGRSSRWNNYLNCPKHLISINKERLLDRTVRLIRERATNIKNYEICIVAFDRELYNIKNTTLIVPECKTEEEKNEYYDNPFIYVSQAWWAQNDNNITVILFGDVYFTEKTIDIIFENIIKQDNYFFYGRKLGSPYTLCKYGEIFAISFSSNFNNMFKIALSKLKQLKNENKIERFISWEVYRELQNIDLFSHEIKNNFIRINDFTEDFDYPDDYDTWISQWNKYKDKYKLEQLRVKLKNIIKIKKNKN
jgi:choline kinase